jgi:hypothetical protein
MIEFQKISDFHKELVYSPATWSLPTIQFDRKIREEASYITVLFIVGRSVIGFRVYWNVTEEVLTHY